jgi:hypothetical protein
MMQSPSAMPAGGAGGMAPTTPSQSLTPEQQQQQQFLQWQQFQQWQAMQQSSVAPNPYAVAAAPTTAQPLQQPLPPFGASPQPLSSAQQQQQTAYFATTTMPEQQQQQQQQQKPTGATTNSTMPQSSTTAAAATTTTTTPAAAGATKESSSSSNRGGCDILGGMTSITTFLNTFNTNGTKLLASLSTSGKEVQQFLNITKTCGG